MASSAFVPFVATQLLKNMLHRVQVSPVGLEHGEFCLCCCLVCLPLTLYMMRLAVSENDDGIDLAGAEVRELQAGFREDDTAVE